MSTDTKAKFSTEATMDALDAAGKVLEGVPGQPVTFRWQVAGRWVLCMHADQVQLVADHIERLKRELQELAARGRYP